MIEITNELTLHEEKQEVAFSKEQLSLDKLMELSTMLSKSTVVPATYMNRPENCFVALDIANRIGMSPMAVMQNLYVIQGKPSWSGQAISAMLRTSNQFKDVTLNFVGKEGTDSWGAYVSAIRTSDGKEITGATVTIDVAKKEGWFQKSGSKWQTMPQLMLGYRAYAWFGRTFAPELLLGLQSVEEVEDVYVESEVVENPYGKK